MKTFEIQPVREKPTKLPCTTIGNNDPLIIMEKRCQDAGIKMTRLRRWLLLGILEAGSGFTVVDVWNALSKVMHEGRVPPQGSIQRNLNLLVEHSILYKNVTSGRRWRYHTEPQPLQSYTITVVEIESGKNFSLTHPKS